MHIYFHIGVAYCCGLAQQLLSKPDIVLLCAHRFSLYECLMSMLAQERPVRVKHDSEIHHGQNMKGVEKT